MNAVRHTLFIAMPLAMALATATASADTCYLVYDRNDQVVYRDLRPPIDLSGPIGPQVNARWRGAALVIVGNAEKCIPLEATDTRTVANLARPEGGTAPDTAKPAAGAAKSTKGGAKPAADSAKS